MQTHNRCNLLTTLSLSLLLSSCGQTVFANNDIGLGSPKEKPIAYVIEAEFGGETKLHETEFSLIEPGMLVIVDGFCLSACTMVLREDFGFNVCYTDAAIFGFHKPYRVEVLTNQPIMSAYSVTVADGSWLKHFYNHFPESIQALFEGVDIPSVAAGAEIRDMFYLKARDLNGAIDACPNNWQSMYDLYQRPRYMALKAQ